MPRSSAPAIFKNCAICDKSFRERKNYNLITCSNKCRGIWLERQKVVLKCDNGGCENTFVVGGKGTKRTRRFCSHSCSAVHHAATRREGIADKSCEMCGVTHRKKGLLCSRQCYLLKHASKPFEELGFDMRRDRVVADQLGKCLECGLGEWRGAPLPLEIDHIDGNNLNDARENLRALCGNCHSITPTWRGRKESRRVTDEELIMALQEKPNIRQALICLGLSPRADNYARAARLKDRVGFEPTVAFATG